MTEITNTNYKYKKIEIVHNKKKIDKLKAKKISFKKVEGRKGKD